MSSIISSMDRSVKVLSSNIDKPELDDRSYRLIKLSENQLEALLVHDPTTEKSSAAMDVHVGSLSDPKDFPGLAHALEHCLFLGHSLSSNINSFQAPRNILRKMTIINFWQSIVAMQTRLPVQLSLKRSLTNRFGQHKLLFRRWIRLFRTRS